MKILTILIVALFLSGCSSTKLTVASFNLGMSMVAPGSYSVAYSSGQQIFKRANNAYDKYIASDDANL
jgi:uncharacterized lipoprotein YmbA